MIYQHNIISKVSAAIRGTPNASDYDYLVARNAISEVKKHIEEHIISRADISDSVKLRWIMEHLSP